MVSHAESQRVMMSYGESHSTHGVSLPHTQAAHRTRVVTSGEVGLTAYSAWHSTSGTLEEVEEWVQTGPSSLTKWIAWQAGWRLFDFDFLLEWGGRYGPAVRQGQWWRWMTWGNLQTGPCLSTLVALFSRSQCSLYCSQGLN